MQKKVVIHKAGSYDQLVLEEFPIPVPGDGDVLIEVRAAGINYADVIIRMGLYASAKELVGWPITPGFEVAGTVRAVGKNVSQYRVGDDVCACVLFNGYSSHVVADERYVFSKPAQLSFEEAAGIPAVFFTAWFALFELAHPRPGAKLLIHSAAGGVGGSLVQLAKLAGCEVVGVVGASHKVSTAKAHGADYIIDKSTENLWEKAREYCPEGYDVILDANGVSTLKDSYEHLRRAGKLVVYGFHTMMPKKGGRPNWLKLVSDYLRTPRFNPLDMTQASKSVLAFNLSYLFERFDILQLAIADMEQWLADGQLKASPITTYPLEDVARAHADIESGQTVGKLILIP